MAGRARGKGRPNLTEAAEIDQVIRQAALQVLLEQGQAATMNAVAVAAGISRKSLYARFSNKTELFLHVIRGLLKDVQRLEYGPASTAEDRLGSYVRAACHVIARPQSLAIQHLLAVDSAYIGELKPDLINATHKIFHEPLAELLDEAAASGELAVENVAETARAIIRLIFAEGAMMGAGGASRTGEQLDAYAEFLSGLVTRGLSPR